LGINTLRDKAKSHLKLLAEEAPLATLQAELAQRDEIIATQTTQIKALQEAVEALKRRVE
jgi:capsule polysaccharide export protein KpsE/RkpR